MGALNFVTLIRYVDRNDAVGVVESNKLRGHSRCRGFPWHPLTTTGWGFYAAVFFSLLVP